MELREGSWNWSWSLPRSSSPAGKLPHIALLPCQVELQDAAAVQHLYSECQRWAGTYMLAESASEGSVRCHLKVGWRQGSPAVHDMQKKYNSYICPSGCLLAVPEAAGFLLAVSGQLPLPYACSHPVSGGCCLTCSCSTWV